MVPPIRQASQTIKNRKKQPRAQTQLGAAPVPKPKTPELNEQTNENNDKRNMLNYPLGFSRNGDRHCCQSWTPPASNSL